MCLIACGGTPSAEMSSAKVMTATSPLIKQPKISSRPSSRIMIQSRSKIKELAQIWCYSLYIPSERLNKRPKSLKSPSP